MENILTISNLSKSFSKTEASPFQKSAQKSFLFQHLNFQLKRNTITLLSGENGVGKTTLFNIICGYEAPDEGEVLFFPAQSNALTHLTKLPPEKIALAGRGIGRLFQHNMLFQETSILENLLIADANTFGEKPFQSLWKLKKHRQLEVERTEKAHQILKDIFGSKHTILQKIHCPAGQFSFGQQRLFSFARLLMRPAELWLLDEPSSGLGEDVVEKVIGIVSNAKNKGKTIFIIEHESILRQIADRCVHLEHEQICSV